MQKWRIACIILMLCAVTSMKAQNNDYQERAQKYIEQFRQLAIEEQRRSGIPAAITLAQGIHETAAGKSELATNANNHFGIKCKKEWTGMTYKYTDDAPDECFRKYDNAEQSYKDHSDYLASSPRYASLFTLSKTDYAGWAAGLKRCGYATNPKYAQLLVKIVEDFELQNYTYVALKPNENPFKESAEKIKEIRAANNGEIIPSQDASPASLTASLNTDEYSPQVNKSKKKGIQVSYGNEPKEVKAEEEKVRTRNPVKPEYGQLVEVNGLKAIYVKKGTVLLNEAFRFNIRYAKLLELNDLVDGPLEADMYIYLEKKNPRGAHVTHIVKPGETISQIAQAEGMQLKFLKYYNHIRSNEEPVPGALLQLQEYTEAKPETYVKSIAPREEPVVAEVSSTLPKRTTRTKATLISKKDIDNASDAPSATAPPAPKEEPVSIENEVAVEEAESGKSKVEAIVKQTQRSYQEQTTPISSAVTQVATPSPAVAVVTVPEVAAKPVEEKKEDPKLQPALIAKTEEPKVAVEVPTAAESASETKEISKAGPQTTEIVKQANTAPIEEIEKQPEIVGTVEPLTVSVSQDAINTISPAPIPTAPVTTQQDIRPSKETHTTDVVINDGSDDEEDEDEEEEPKVPQGPQDEFSRLKAQLDKVVYSSDNIASSEKTAAKAETKTEVKKATEEKPKTEAVTAEGTPSFYTVKKGDTAFSIAKKHKITMTQLNEWNKLEFKAVKVGQKLRVK